MEKVLNKIEYLIDYEKVFHGCSYKPIIFL